MTDWPVKTLGEVCEIYQPQTIGMKDMVAGGAYIVYGANGPIGHYDRFNHENSEVTVTCRGATCGTVNVTPPQVWITGNAMVVRPEESVMTKQMLRYLLEGLDYSSVITGTAQPQITRTTLAPLQIPVPPLEEQKRIVALLDAATASITELTACYEQARTHANNLFTSALRDALEGNPDWPVKTLGDLMTVQNGYAFDSKFFSPEGNIGLIRIRDLKGGIETETRFTGRYGDGYVVSAGDYLIGMDGEFRCYEWKGEPALLNQRVCRLQEFSNSLESRFLFYGINKFLKDIEDVTGYTTVKHLSSKSILSIEIPLPPLGEQKRIVARLDEMRAKTSEMVAAYDAKLTAAKNLRQSILEAAFAGEL